MTDIPTGTVTLLTARIDPAAAATSDAALRFERVVRAAAEIEHGYVFRSGAGSIGVGFAAPGRAVGAAVAIQRAWAKAAGSAEAAVARPADSPADGSPAGAGIAIAIHAGTVRAHHGEYAGPAVDRAWALAEIGHAGQTLASRLVEGLLIDIPVPGVVFRDLGPHRLFDLARPEHVFQVDAPGLPDGFPRLRSLDALPHNLPAHPTNFVGRRRDLAELRQIVRTARLVTLTGAGGAGKTRLAMQLAVQLAPAFPDGAWVVDLAPVADDERVALAVGSALGLGGPAEPTTAAGLAAALAGRRMVVVLDNCEHVAAACGRLAEAVIAVAPETRIIATSREPLNAARELAWRVPPLALPDPGRVAGSDDDVSQYAAMQLFLDRAQAAVPGFRADNANTPAIAGICHRLGGMPLAIEIAAAGLREAAPDDIVHALGGRARALAGDPDAPLPRAESLRLALAWAEEGLAEPERRLFARLAVFVGGFTTADAAEVCGGADLPADDVPALVRDLAARALIAPANGGDGERFRMLEPVRQFAAERLQASGERSFLHYRHLHHFLAEVETADAFLTGPQQDRWLWRLDGDHDNVRGALEWALAEGDTGAALRFGRALWRFWMARGYLSEGRHWLVRVLELPDVAAYPDLEARGLYAAGGLAWAQGALDVSASYMARAQERFEAVGDRQGLAWAMNDFGLLADEAGDYGRAESLFQASLALKRELGTEWDVAIALNNLGVVAIHRGDLAGARVHLDQALAIAQHVGHLQVECLARSGLADAALLAGDPGEAKHQLARTEDIAARIGDRMLLAEVAADQAEVWLIEGDAARARAAVAAALEHASAIEYRPGLLIGLDRAAAVALAEGNAARAATLAAAADHAAAQPGGRRHVRPPDRQARYQAIVDDVRRQIGDAAFDAAYAAGRAMSVDEAVAYALGDVDA